MAVNWHEITLVFGAGAHKPYGFPTAKDLTKTFLRLASPRPDYFASSDIDLMSADKNLLGDKLKINCILQSSDFFNEQGRKFSFRMLDEFLHSFRQSLVYSIDSFLSQPSRRLEEMEEKIFIGKCLISYFLRKAEIEHPQGYSEFDWIEVFVNQYLPDKNSMETFLRNPPTIITFNYDRYFEKCLRDRLVHLFAYSEDEATRLIKQINVRHVYGSLGEIDYHWDPNDSGVYSKVVNGLRVAGEERKKVELENISSEFLQAINASQKLYFLGFAFDQLNLRVLFGGQQTHLKSNLPRLNVYATDFELPTTALEVLRNYGISFNEVFGLNSKYARQIKCDQLIRDLAPFG